MRHGIERVWRREVRRHKGLKELEGGNELEETVTAELL